MSIDRAQPNERFAGRHELRRSDDPWKLATGTLACPSCDAPVLPAAGGMSPSEAMSCAYCSHLGVAREFLSLTEPTRPTRVAVRVRLPVASRAAG